MATKDCIAKVAAARGITDKEAEAVLDAVDARAQRLERQEGLSHLDALRQAQTELVNEAAAAKAIETRNRLMNLQKRIDRRNRMVETADQVRKGSDPDLVHAVMNQETARNTPTFGNRASAEAEWAALSDEYAAGLTVQLRQRGLIGFFRDAKNSDAWARELYELSRQAAGEADAKPGLTGSPKALEVAKIVHGVQQAARARANREGAWIGDYAGWITSTQHDSHKLWNAGFEKWRDYILPRLDADRTFEGVDDRETFLRGTWEALVSGVHLADKEAVGMKDPAFSGPSNIAAKLSESRKLHFSDATSWLQYQREFGRGALNEQVMQSLERTARATALLRRWGTNPEAELQADIQWMQEHYRSSAPMAVARLGDARGGVKTRMDYLTGAANIPGNVAAAEIAASFRAIQSMAKLGGVAFTHLSAFTTKAAELRYHGVGFFERWGNSIDSLMQGRGRGEQRDLADLLLAGVEGTHGYMLSRFHAGDAPSGHTAKLSNWFMQATGLTWMLDAQKSGAARMMSRLFGQNLDTVFDRLAPELQRTLTSYGISKEAWEAIRTSPRYAVDGRNHLTPDAAHGISDDMLATLRPKLTGKPAAARPVGTPNPAPGFVRFYHGGVDYAGGTRWLTEDRRYAQGYADKAVGGGKLYYVDLREGGPELANVPKVFDDTGAPMRSPYVHFDAPEEIAKRLKPLLANESPAEAAIDARTRDDLYLKLRMMFLDIADRGVITPGIEEKALYLGGTAPGTLFGEGLRFLAQFKTWGAAAIRQDLGREMYGGQSTMGKVSGMFQLALGSAVMGYLTMTLKDLFKGKTPRSPTDPATVFAAMIQGGGFGILGDYMFGEFNRFGQSPVEALAGPAAGTVADVLKEAALARGWVVSDPNARAKDFWPGALRIFEDNTPFLNLFYLRRTLDYLLLHSAQESMNPGYLQRAERSLQKKTNQQYLSWPVDMSPTNHLHTFGR